MSKAFWARAVTSVGSRRAGRGGGRRDEVVVSPMKNELSETVTRSLALRGAAAIAVLTTLVAVVEAGKKW
jgi:hypothetical protein